MSSTYLKKSIAAILAMAALGHSLEAGATGNNNSSTNELDPVVVPFVPNPYDVGGGYTGIDFAIYDGNVGGGDESSGGGGEEGTGEICPALRLRKPTNCYGPGEVKGGAWGRSFYPFSSGLRQLISIVHPDPNPLNNSAIYDLEPGVWGILAAALDRHTNDAASLTVAYDEANARLLETVRSGCDRQQAIWGNAGGCYMVLRTLAREHFGQTDGLREFLSGLDGFLRPVVDFFVPDNSLRIRYDSAREQVRCNAWFEEIKNNGC